MGIEPTLFAWEARVLPLNDTRSAANYRHAISSDRELWAVFFAPTRLLYGQWQQLPATGKVALHPYHRVHKLQAARQQLQGA